MVPLRAYHPIGGALMGRKQILRKMQAATSTRVSVALKLPTNGLSVTSSGALHAVRDRNVSQSELKTAREQKQEFNLDYNRKCMGQKLKLEMGPGSLPNVEPETK
ncbi:hypothetical protein EVAR_75443_1 [Eumeta japonica]|uniref:Uncharacterized protein n=1 Tax=Eumeta variegata TaxID=151549 RepID=A0A4C1TJX6_EUMVA|nr:hypothetical protein EVAR_75443_1 [Eumeta japonica]